MGEIHYLLFGREEVFDCILIGSLSVGMATIPTLDDNSSMVHLLNIPVKKFVNVFNMYKTSLKYLKGQLNICMKMIM